MTFYIVKPMTFFLVLHNSILYACVSERKGMMTHYKYEGENATKMKSLQIQKAIAEVEGDAIKVEMLELKLENAKLKKELQKARGE